MVELEREAAIEQYAPFIRAFADQLVAGTATCSSWTRRVRSERKADVESAIGEALAWDYLRCRVDSVGPIEADGEGRSPDFLCVGKCGSSFAVEVKTLTTEKVSEWTGLHARYEPTGYGPFASWAPEVKGLLSKSTSQGAGIEMPRLIFFVTLHTEATALLCDRLHVEEILHSRSFIASAFDPRTGASGPVRHLVDFQHAAFTNRSMSPMRRNVSGFLVGGFGCIRERRERIVGEVNVLGGLNPTARYPFDPKDLDDVPFGRFRDWPIPSNGEVDIEWTS